MQFHVPVCYDASAKGISLSSKVNKYCVIELRFSPRAIFHDLYGDFIEAIQRETDLPHWLMQPARNVTVHDGDAGGDLSYASERVVVSQNNFVYLMVNPTSTSKLLNSAKGVTEVIERFFPEGLNYVRFGARSLRFIPIDLEFSELVSRFSESYIDPTPLSNLLFSEAKIEDVGYSINHSRGLTRINLSLGPMTKEQATKERFNGIINAEALHEWSETGIFLDLDSFQTEGVSQRLVDIRKTLKTFLDEHDEVAGKLIETISPEKISSI